MNEIAKQAASEIGAYFLQNYRDERGTLHAANAVSALGACAGAFAQVQARALVMYGKMQRTKTTLYEVTAADGKTYIFGDAINLCLFESVGEKPSFWNLAGGVARDPEIARKIDLQEIARRAAKGVGGADFGRPRVDSRYQSSQLPIDAVRTHGQVLLRRFLDINLDPSELMASFGSAALSFGSFAAGEVREAPVNVAMTRPDIARLYMEAAIPMSKFDLPSIGIGWR